ncbi:MAG: hypothetical protein ACLPUO_14870 [Streptosporangiaceae bacterium]
MTDGSGQTTLIVLRGNSGSGKSTVADALGDAYGRGVAWVPQVVLRRTILRERERPGPATSGTGYLPRDLLATVCEGRDPGGQHPAGKRGSHSG